MAQQLIQSESSRHSTSQMTADYSETGWLLQPQMAVRRDNSTPPGQEQFVTNATGSATDQSYDASLERKGGGTVEKGSIVGRIRLTCRDYKVYQRDIVCLLCGIIGVILGIALILSPLRYYYYPPGTKGCTEYESVSTDTTVCGVGHSCSYRGVYTSVADGYSPRQPIRAWLVRRENLVFYTRQHTFHSNGTVLVNVLFESLNPVYLIKNSVISGFCSVHNQNSESETAKLDIYSDFDDAIMATGKNVVFTETLSIPGNSQEYFHNWGPDKPFRVPTNGYFFFLLSVSADNMNYNIEKNTSQVYVNESDYRNPQYFTSDNRSHYSYRKCYRNGRFTQTEYVTLCKAPSEDVVTGRLHILSCPDLLKWSNRQTHILMGVGIVVLLSGFILILVCVAIKIRQKVCYKTATLETSSG